MDFVSLISNVGFPIASCIAMGVFVVKQLEKQNDTVNELTKVVQENTNAILKLTDKLATDNKEKE